MLLFKPEHKEPILSRTKTETRRIWSKRRAKPGSTHLAKTKMLSKEYFAKLRILEVYKEWLLDITDEGSRAEGYKDRADYLNAFYRINKIELWEILSGYNPLVHVVKFKLEE